MQPDRGDVATACDSRGRDPGRDRPSPVTTPRATRACQTALLETALLEAALLETRLLEAAVLRQIELACASRAAALSERAQPARRLARANRVRRRRGNAM